MSRRLALGIAALLTLGLLLSGNTAAASSSSDTIVVRGHNVTIRGCNIDGADRGIIVTGTARNVLIDDCLIRNTARSGIVVWGAAQNVTITNTTILDPGLDGITAYNHQTSDLKLSNVTVRDADNHGMHLGGTNVSLVNVTSVGHTHAGVMVANHTNRPKVHNVVISNLITEGGRWGLWLRRIHRVDLGPVVVVEGRTLIQDCTDADGNPCPGSR
jgi:parallel beta-helix repeat protein